MDSNLQKKEKILINIIAKILKINKNQIKYNSKIGQTINWDSLNHIKIYFELKKKFKKDVNFDNLSHVKSIKDWIKLFLYD
jgi:acyl carrier protein